MLKKKGQEAFALIGFKMPAIERKGPLDHGSPPVPGIGTHGFLVHRRQAGRGNGVIQRIEQVGRGIHKRSVKVKGDDVC